MNPVKRKRLIQKALRARRGSYAPYSKFMVGAALMVSGGKVVITGANVENASYGLTICAERAALAAAVAAGHRRFEAIAVAAPGAGAVFPCGACLQVLAEFCGPDFDVILVPASRPAMARDFKLRDLLPHAFSL